MYEDAEGNRYRVEEVKVPLKYLHSKKLRLEKPVFKVKGVVEGRQGSLDLYRFLD